MPRELRDKLVDFRHPDDPIGTPPRKREPRSSSVVLYLIRMTLYFSFGVTLVNFLLWLTIMEWRWLDPLR